MTKTDNKKTLPETQRKKYKKKIKGEEEEEEREREKLKGAKEKKKTEEKNKKKNPKNQIELVRVCCVVFARLSCVCAGRKGKGG